MGSLSKPRCARGHRCYHVLKLRSEEPPTVGREGELCDKCQNEHAGGYGSQGTGRWIGEVTSTIGVILAARGDMGPTGKASLWDLFDLDTHNGGLGKSSDRGEVLGRLNVKTLVKLRDWLEVNAQEVVNRYGRDSYAAVRSHVGAFLAIRYLSPGEDLFADDGGPWPLPGVARGPDGRTLDIVAPIRAAFRRKEIQLRQKPRFVTERDLEKQLVEEYGVSRSTIRRWFARLKETGLHKITPADLIYMRKGKKRGCERTDQDA